MSRTTSFEMPRTAPCPGCGTAVARLSVGSPIRHLRERDCPTCGLRLHHAVPVIAPPMGGPCWWGWRAPDGRVSWDRR
jgi:hypothetical protein